jgi:hypothetical protein
MHHAGECSSSSGSTCAVTLRQQCVAPRHMHAADDHPDSLYAASCAPRFAYFNSIIKQPRIGMYCTGWQYAMLLPNRSHVATNLLLAYELRMWTKFCLVNCRLPQLGTLLDWLQDTQACHGHAAVTW